MNVVFRHRAWLASGYAVAAMLALAFAPVPHLQPPRLPDEQLMQVTLEAVPEPEPEKVPERAPPKIVPPAQPQVQPAVMPREVPKPQKVKQPALAPYAARQVAMPAAPPATEVAEAQPVVSPQPPPPVATGPVAKTPEEIYIAGLHQYLESIKRYPTSREARLEHPSGEAAVWFVLSRDGGLVDSGLEHGSGSMLLDQAALSTVRRGEYHPFPAATWEGKPDHRFTARLNFSVDHN